MQRIFPNLIIAVKECLQNIFVEGFYADKVIERVFKANKKWGSRDRKFIAESVYDIVRWKNYYNYLLEKNEDNLEELLGVWLFLKQQDSQLLSDTSLDKVNKNLKNKTANYIEQSYPKWLYDHIYCELGEDWHSIARALNQEAKLFLRVNTTKINRSDLIQRLQNEGIEALPVENIETCIVIPSKKNVFQTKSFSEGLFEVQDAASQMVCPNLKLKKGQRLVDACAGAGGKSLHAACIMENKGKIIALDIHENKLKQLKKRAKRNSLDIIEARLIENSKTIKRLHKSADALLLDVPCSGLGVIKRNPDTKWKINRARMIELQGIQKDILKNYSPILKVGGTMVYATCSILPSENQNQITDFLNNNSNYKLLGDKTIRPDVEGYDGFYLAVLKRIQ